MAPSSFLFFFLLTVTSTATHNRRALHQPFFPKYSSSSYSSSSSHTTFGAFFPLEPSPPNPPPASSTAAFPTFPVNVSSTTDASSTSPSRRSPSNLLPAVATPLLAVAFLVLSFVLFFHLRHRQGGVADNDVGSDSIRFFPPPAASSGEQEISAAAPSSAASLGGSELLSVGVAGSSHRDTSESCASGGFTTYWKLRSPELRPLPPLPRQVLLSGEACRSSTSDEEICSVNTSPPPPPKHTSLLRPPTPSPPKRRPPAHSPPSSPFEAESDEKAGNLQYSPRKNLRSPRKIGDFARRALVGGQNPPPPAPVPAAGSDEGQNVKIPTFRLPLLAPPRDSVLKKTVISRENPNAAEVHEEDLGPKLKRLHSDKSQAIPEH
ncbi:formin-like protein 1 [Zingiber officinale]|uniref:formin-like protein 1 n=1 Tax=Zingiber officinale TaxID=94328 RepID=UPI001C4D2DBF|nr:formin-like protein 1 [Zingiber officinale]